MLIDTIVCQKISNDRKESALYLLLEQGWEIERIADALGISAKSIGQREENYATHGCVKPCKPIKGCPKLLIADMIDNTSQMH